MQFGYSHACLDERQSLAEGAQMKKYDKIVFVSTDDTAGSPMADGIMRKLSVGRDLAIASRGMIVLFQEPINPTVIAVAEAHDVTLGHRMTTAFSEKDIGDRNLILTMTQKQRDTIYESYENAMNVYTIQEFLGADGDVEMPLSGEKEDYKECFNRINILVKLVAEKIFTEEDMEE